MQFFMKRQNFKVFFFLVNFSVHLCQCTSFVCFHLFFFCKYTGVNIFWCWILLCAHRVANHRHDFGGIWVHCPLQVRTIISLRLVKLLNSVVEVCCWWIVCLAVASGQHWQCFCRRFQFSDGCSNSHLLDRYVQFVGPQLPIYLWCLLDFFISECQNIYIFCLVYVVIWI